MTRSDSAAPGAAFFGALAERSYPRRSILRWGAAAGAADSLNDHLQKAK